MPSAYKSGTVGYNNISVVGNHLIYMSFWIDYEFLVNSKYIHIKSYKADVKPLSPILFIGVGIFD